MAKTEYTRDTISAFIKGLDTRARTLEEPKINEIINRGYAELSTVSKRLFSNEEVIDMQQFYDSGEVNISIDLEEDVTEVYDLYTTIEGEDVDTSVCQEVIQGIGIYRDSDFSFRDNRYIGRVHLDLDGLSGMATDVVFDNLIVKYYYTPKATTESVFMDSQVYLTFQDAMWAALNYFMKDIEGEAQKRSSMQRTSKSAAQEPEDIPDMGRAMFGGI